MAIKVVRNVPKYQDAAKIEINILEDLRDTFLKENEAEPLPFVVLWDWFKFHGHVCMVFEPLGPRCGTRLLDLGPCPPREHRVPARMRLPLSRHSVD